MADKPQTITIDGTEYRYADLSEKARRQISNVSMVDKEITRLENQRSLHETARLAYGRALAEALPE